MLFSNFLSESCSKDFLVQIRFLICIGGFFTSKVSIEDAGQKKIDPKDKEISPPGKTSRGNYYCSYIDLALKMITTSIAKFSANSPTMRKTNTSSRNS